MVVLPLRDLLLSYMRRNTSLCELNIAELLEHTHLVSVMQEPTYFKYLWIALILILVFGCHTINEFQN
jgi:hypothetical protein